MEMSDWREISECRNCQHMVTKFDSSFIEICPKCAFEDDNRGIWAIRVTRFISSSIWWKPSTWSNGTIEFKDGEKRIVKKGKVVETKLEGIM